MTTSGDGKRYTLDDLLNLMACLRDPQYGCPWDVKQNWASIVPHTLEEAYEVADAIERGAFDELPGELGDLLFQVIYYTQFGREEGRFDFNDIVHTLTAKMVARHPHVFPDGTLASRREDMSAAEVEQQQVHSRWETRKAQERAGRQAYSALDDVPLALPALSRAQKLSKRAARVGFDWPDSHGAIAKINEELVEVEEAISSGNKNDMHAELGDLLFSVVNLARQLGIDPEQALRATNAKFERRFRYVEQALAAQGKRCEDVPLEEMDYHWDAAKRVEAKRD